jgi:p-aminobenzoyl-glutamate transporter AbgT
MTDNELDNLIKNKLNNQTFEYEDSYWQQAEKMIDAQRFETKKLVWYKSAFYVAIAAVFALLGWFLVENNKITSPKTAINTNTENAQMLQLELKSSATYSQPKAAEANKSVNSNSINRKENSILVESNDKNNDTKIIRTAKNKLQNIAPILGNDLTTIS